MARAGSPRCRPRPEELLPTNRQLSAITPLPWYIGASFLLIQKHFF